MKKILNAFLLLIIIPFLLFFFSQCFLKLNIKVMPNIFLIYFIFVSSSTNYKISYILAFILGIISGMLFYKYWGICVLAFILIYQLIRILNNILKDDNKITAIIKIISITFIFESVIYLISLILARSNIETLAFLKILLREIIMNILLVIILYKPFIKFKNNIKGIYEKSNIYTRYF